MTTAPQINFRASPFHTTRWSGVCLAKADSEDGRRALADLCDAYYEPVVAYLRSVLRDPDAALEMSHAFFAEMLGGGTIHTADQERGRFRSYLLTEDDAYPERSRAEDEQVDDGKVNGVVSLWPLAHAAPPSRPRVP